MIGELVQDLVASKDLLACVVFVQAWKYVESVFDECEGSDYSVASAVSLLDGAAVDMPMAAARPHASFCTQDIVQVGMGAEVYINITACAMCADLAACDPAVQVSIHTTCLCPFNLSCGWLGRVEAMMSQAVLVACP